MPSRPTTPISKKAQSSSCSDLDSEVTVPVPWQTEVSISVWRKPPEFGISLLSTNQRTFIYTGPQALSWRPSTIRSQVGPGLRLTLPTTVVESPFKLLVWNSCIYREDRQTRAIMLQGGRLGYRPDSGNKPRMRMVPADLQLQSTHTRARMHAHAPGIRPLPASVRRGDSAMLSGKSMPPRSLRVTWVSSWSINPRFASNERRLQFRSARDGCGGSHQRQVLTVLSTWASLSVHHDQGKQ